MVKPRLLCYKEEPPHFVTLSKYLIGPRHSVDFVGLKARRLQIARRTVRLNSSPRKRGSSHATRMYYGVDVAVLAGWSSSFNG